MIVNQKQNLNGLLFKKTKRSRHKKRIQFYSFFRKYPLANGQLSFNKEGETN